MYASPIQYLPLNQGDTDFIIRSRYFLLPLTLLRSTFMCLKQLSMLLYISTLVLFVVSPRESRLLCSLRWLTVSRVVTWVLHRYGPKPAFTIAGLTLALGSLMRYTGTLYGIFEMIVCANLLFGAGASFALIMPTHYSDLWFSPAGRMGATAVASLAYPVGSAVSSLNNRSSGISQ
jgi:hypothetical protein